MTKVSRRSIGSEKFGQYANNLWSAFTLTDSKDDVRFLFKDLLTHTEFKMFAKRLEIARQLLLGENYQNIQTRLKVNSSTISRINNVLASRGEGFRKAHEKLTKLENVFFQRQREKNKNYENPFRRKIKAHGKTLLGEALKAGVIALDKAVVKKLKHGTAKKDLPV